MYAPNSKIVFCMKLSHCYANLYMSAVNLVVHVQAKRTYVRAQDVISLMLMMYDER